MTIEMRSEWFVRIELDRGALSSVEEDGFWGKMAGQGLLQVWQGLPSPSTRGFPGGGSLFDLQAGRSKEDSTWQTI